MNHKGFSKRLRNLGIPASVAKEISLRWQTQLDSRGQEGAVEYLKRVGDTVIWFLTGSGGKPEWVKVDKTGFPAFLDGCQDQPTEVLVRLAKLARSIKLDKPSDRQIGKVLPAVVTPFDGDPAFVSLVSTKLKEVAEHLHGKDTRILYQPKYPLILKQWRSVQSVSGSTPVRSEPPLVESLALLKRKEHYEIVSAIPKWESCFYPIHPKALDQMIRVSKGEGTGCVGEIHATQEGAAKLRMFAAPYTVFQSLLTPLHEFISEVRKRLPTDCTYNQESGALFAQSALQSGLVVHSVDLSTATCRFPLEPQIAVLEGLSVPKEQIDLLMHVCKGKWEIQEDLRPYFEMDHVRWAVGQPLGIRPSMSMFSLTHNLLLTWLCWQRGLKPSEVFRVLGDDVVIVNDDIHSDYRFYISKLGVPISESKSHSSTQYAEFAGYSIFPTEMVRAGQWKQLTFDNFSGLASQLVQPEVSEGSPFLLKAIRLLRFMDGLYTPSSEDYPLYEAAAQVLSTSEILVETKFRSTAPLWCFKVQDYVKAKFPGVEPKFFSVSLPTACSLLRGIQDCPDWLRNLAYTKDEFQSDHGEPITMVGFILALSYFDMARMGSPNVSSLPVEQVVQIISENTNAELWSPPSKRRNSVRSEFQRMVGALRSSGLIV